jgi:hypothetical protein
LLGLAELEVADLLGNDGALSLGVELGDELGLEAASLLGVQVTNLLRDIEKRSDDLIVALFRSFDGRAALTTNFNRKFFTSGVSYKFARLLLDVTGSTAGFIDGTALLGARSVADLFQGTVALLHSLFGGLLLEGDLTRFFKVLLANFFLSGLELRDVGVMALFDVLVGALEDGILLQRGDGLLFLDTAQTGVWVGLAVGEVDSAGDGSAGLTALPAQYGLGESVVVSVLMAVERTLATAVDE